MTVCIGNLSERSEIAQFLSQAIDAHNAKFDREMVLHGKNLSEEEFEKLMKAHKAELQALEMNLDREKQRQNKTLADKVNLINMSHLI